MKRLLAALCLCSVAAVAHAEISQKFGNLEIHYNALTTDELQPEVARAYKIERSKTRGMVTLSVLKKNKLGALTPVPAKLTVYATNLTQQLSNITMREIKEGTAIYYLGEFRVTPPDTLKFTATVEVAGEPKYDMTFDQKFFR
ncbi:MAG: DUF4426 domain-containing protein [Thiobacillus sp.]|nr:DUF4426 domain-containing protein [Gammaproteobacteria bacterium]MDO9008397.1 DUF4426 domain-containing protein [Thiobacillus sp.]OGU22533.1 MAG: hypothetical protein A2580_03560 [Hydrogenophilales bacterium RIFOXYD1_FULL_62_11]MBU4498651.1 DUF4426 domain-containing protein [Gammaproteobacteria bacterium]MDP1926129.1 DUF4426 domain-containing protein [Thiobacillus sp.]